MDQRLLARMKEQMREARHADASQAFCDLLKDGASPRSLGLEAITSASPFLNVPAHTMVTKAGETRPVNYDHTVLAFWRAYQLGKLLPKGYRELPLVQAMWYLPQGLDIWSQILCEFPGHYANEQEKCASINLKGPRQHFEELPPLTEGSWDERLARMLDAIINGDRSMAFRAFLGLADEAATDPEKRKTLEANVLYAGIIDLPGPRTYSIHIVNSAHKAIRARAMVELAGALGWERAYPVYLVVIPDLAAEPRFHDIFETAHIQLIGAFGADYHGRRHTNTGRLSVREAEDFMSLMFHGTPEEVIAGVTGLLVKEKSLTAINDVCVVASARLMAKVETPSIRAGFTQTDHAFDYANVVGHWLRTYDHHQQMKSPYYTAHFVNDVAKFLRTRPADPATQMESQPEEHRARADKLSLKECLQALGSACDTQDAPFAHALTDSYMARTHDRVKLMDTLRFGSAKFEGDPHMPRNAMSHWEEYNLSSLPAALTDDIFRSWTRFLARSHKRSYEFNAFDLYERELLTPAHGR
jgi:hypothetical protein